MKKHSQRGTEPGEVGDRSDRTTSESPAAGDSAEAEPARATDDARFPVVGLGASAGGLGALEQFFESMPADTGMAFVVVTHQHPGQPSLLAELLGRRTEMPVVQVTRATPVEPNHVYTGAPGHNLAILRGVLQPMAVDGRSPPLPVDYFFRSLAKDQRELAIGIVLSGTGSDGSLGLKEIKGGLGMVMAQEERSAQYGGMPHSAIATQLVDYVLPASEMPGQLLSYVRASGLGRAEAVIQPPLEALQQVFVIIRDRTGHDFSQYKESTIGRRIERRMNVHHVDTLTAYVSCLQTNPGEVDLLFKELLIGVTSFFRDPQAWSVLSTALAQLLKDKPNDYEVRAWVPGCSTGEEAYSLAISLRETMDELKRTLSVQIFATDLDQVAIDVARSGVYPVGIASDLSPERLGRFFTREDETYRVRKEIREMLVFAPQNLIADPPFTKLDLLCCRNLLIYLDSKLQHRLLPLFHYALKPHGLMFLGTSESIGTFVDLFSPVDKRAKVFRRSGVVSGARVAEFSATTPELNAHVPPTRRPEARARDLRLEQVMHKMLLADLVPATVIVHERGDVVLVHGHTGLFLEPAQGSPTAANVFNMARPGLQIGLAAAIRQAATSEDEVVQRGVQVKSNGGVISAEVRVKRIQDPEPLRGLFRVSFVPVPRASPEGNHGPSSDGGVPPKRLTELERQLESTRESHQGTIEELETANEELKSTNEELQSTNEELQSANEELETAKEEMQSSNEELQTVNAELQGKVDELSHANNDMKNLLNGTDIATVFLDNELRIKRYTERAKRVIRLIPTDVGRPVGDLVSTLHYENLIDDAREVLETLVFKEIELQGANGECYLMRILPYRTTENVIDGLVLTFVDVSRIKTLQREQERLIDVLRHSPTSVFEQDKDLCITWSSGAAFGKAADQLVGKSDEDLFPDGEAERLRAVKREVLQSGAAQLERVELTVNGARRSYQLYLEPRKNADGEVTGLSCLATDITSHV